MIYGTAVERKNGDMRSDSYMTTGEAAILLNVSRSSVSRMFDKGILGGSVNPITRERTISRESVVSLMQKYNLPIDQLAVARTTVLVGSPHGGLWNEVQAAGAADHRLTFARAALGADVLIECSSLIPDILIIDDALEDINCLTLVASIRKRVVFDSVRILCCVRRSPPMALLAAGASACVMMDGADAGVLLEQIYLLLGMPAEGSLPGGGCPQPGQHLVREANLPARLSLFRLSAPDVIEPGSGTVCSISPRGAMLSAFRTQNNRIPEEPFRVAIEVNGPELPDWQAVGHLVRLHGDKVLTACVRFTDISDVNRHKITLLPE